jgi:hypothetical protein
MSKCTCTPGVSPGTPEDLFVLPPGKLPEFPVDALNCTLSRASSVLLLLSADGGSIKDGFSLHHVDVMNVIWCIEGLLEQAKMLTERAHQDARS